MDIDELEVYQLAMDLGERIWGIVIKWDYFAKDTVGKQLIRSMDSVAANLSEGFGRFFFKENQKFCYYGRGSLSETKTWVTKAFNRQLMTDQEFRAFLKDIKNIGVKLNNYIHSIGKKPLSDH